MTEKRKVLNGSMKSRKRKMIVESSHYNDDEVKEIEDEADEQSSSGHVRSKTPLPSTLRDAKYREKLKNSVNLLEMVLPLSKQTRTRQKLYEDAIHLTALLQESLFHLVNRLRVQNHENICNFAIFTPSYVQVSFVDLMREVEKEIKNGTQINAELVKKMSYLASEFFTGLVEKCSHYKQQKKICDDDHEMKPSIHPDKNSSSNTNYNIRQPVDSCPQQSP